MQGEATEITTLIRMSGPNGSSMFVTQMIPCMRKSYRTSWRATQTGCWMVHSSPKA